jgi:hypothetical protein
MNDNLILLFERVEKRLAISKSHSVLESRVAKKVTIFALREIEKDVRHLLNELDDCSRLAKKIGLLTESADLYRSLPKLKAIAGGKFIPKLFS